LVPSSVKMYRLISLVTLTTCQGITLRHGAGVQMFDKKGKSHMFTSRKAAMGAGMLTGHFPDVDSCHSACQAAMGCGHDQECLCNCCDVGAMENDGCFCYSCGPMGAPQTLWSEHENVNPRSNPLNSSEEPDQCTGTKQMCGGMFGDTSRSQETQAQKEARLEKQRLAAIRAKEELENKMAQMAKDAADAKASQELAYKATQALQNAKDEAAESKKMVEEKTGEVDDLENKLTKQNNLNDSKEKDMSMLKVKEEEQDAEIESLRQNKKLQEEKIASAEARAEMAKEHAEALSQEVDKVSDVPNQAKLDAKLLESELTKLKDSGGPPPKPMSNVKNIGEQIQEETLAKEAKGHAVEEAGAEGLEASVDDATGEEGAEAAGKEPAEEQPASQQKK
jgi:hypothetical protein